MATKQGYPFDITKFPDDDDILLDEKDLKRNRIVYCRKEILDQMKCTEWAKEEYLIDGLDPNNTRHWIHYHLQKCYTPYQNGLACVLEVRDKEIQKMKQEAGADGWKLVEEQFIQDHAKRVGATQAKKLWEYQTNAKEIHAKARAKEGYMFGEGKPPADNSHGIEQVELMFATAKQRELEQIKKQSAEKKKPLWGFGS